MSIRVSVIGFRHYHIFDLVRRVQEMDGIELVAACEEDAVAREQAKAQAAVDISFDSAEQMLAEVDCDVVAVGDFYARRGELLIRALELGKHVISDKPLCTRMDELDEIERLARSTGLKVGCMLDMRDGAPFIGVRDLVRSGTIGEVHAIGFGGQHQLRLGKRPSWYFEKGKHGGTINDIGIHALDIIPWITGHRFESIVAARCWNAKATDTPWFKGAGQLMLAMDNGCGVLGDVSYLAPDRTGYTLPFYWRMTLWGELGVIETSHPADSITLALDGESQIRSVPIPPGNPGGYLRAFVADISGDEPANGLDTEAVISSARTAVAVQRAADLGQYNASL